MKIGLFIPCYMNELYPEASMATLKILENLGLEVEYPMEQTCCGQPMANTGLAPEAKGAAIRFLNIFKKYDYVVCPSGSCVAMVRDNYAQFCDGLDGFDHLKTHIYEIVEFLHDVIKPTSLNASFPHKVSIHDSCHGLRSLDFGSMSERNQPQFSKLRNMLALVKDIEYVEITRKDECCGFGGTFCVTEAEVSAAMGKDRVADHVKAGSEVITGVDQSCLMHMQGVIDRDKLPVRTLHVAQILAGDA